MPDSRPQFLDQRGERMLRSTLLKYLANSFKLRQAPAKIPTITFLAGLAGLNLFGELK